MYDEDDDDDSLSCLCAIALLSVSVLRAPPAVSGTLRLLSLI